MTIENELKRAMNYTDADRDRCDNCTHCDERPPTEPGGFFRLFCTANKAAEFEVSQKGRCDHFSARRRRRPAPLRIADHSNEIEENTYE